MIPCGNPVLIVFPTKENILARGVLEISWSIRGKETDLTNNTLMPNLYPIEPVGFEDREKP